MARHHPIFPRIRFAGGSGPGPDPDPEPAAFARTASTNSTMSIHSGHSLTDSYVHIGPFPSNLRALLGSVGITDAYGRVIKSTIPGSNLSWRWDNPVEDNPASGEADARLNIEGFHTLMITEGGPPPRTTSEGMVNTLDYFCRFAANTVENGAGDEVILWSIWPDLLGPGGAEPPAEWTGYTFRTGLTEYENSFKYMADYATWKMRQLYPSLPEDWRVWLFPGHKWMERVYDDIQNDLVPGVTDIQELFGDGIHPDTTACYGLSCLVATCLYQVNLTEAENVWIMPEWENHDGPHSAVPQALAEYFWQIAWEIATAYEPVGMGGTEGAALRWQPSDGDPMPNWTLANPDTSGGGGDPDPDPEPEPGEMPETVFLLNNDGSPYSGPTPSTALPALVDGAYTFATETTIAAPNESDTNYICVAVWNAAIAEDGEGMGALQIRMTGGGMWANPRMQVEYNAVVHGWTAGASLVGAPWPLAELVSQSAPNTEGWHVVELMVEGTVITMRGDGNDIVHDINDYPEMDPEGLDNLSTVAFPAWSTDVRFAFVAYAQEIPDATGRAAMRAEAQAAIARAEA